MAKKIPYEFLLEELYTIDPLVKAFFGAHGIYRKETVLFILRKKEEHPEDNGIWLATSKDHHSTLKKEFPSLRNIHLLGTNTNWLNLPEESDHFEEDALKIAGLVLKNDHRIGRLPSKKKK